jgi:hypothetical protein
MRFSESDVERPVFFIGMPRSGTSIVFAAFAAHRDLSWFSQYSARFWFLPGVGLLGRIPSIIPAARQPVGRHGEARSLADRMESRTL